MSTGDLINDTVVQIIQANGRDVDDCAHLIALSSRIMRNILVDRARKDTDKRRHAESDPWTGSRGNRGLTSNCSIPAPIRLGAIDATLVELIEKLRNSGA